MSYLYKCAKEICLVNDSIIIIDLAVLALSSDIVTVVGVVDAALLLSSDALSIYTARI